MSGRSSLLSAAALLAACGGSKKAPEADPAKLAPIWKQMVLSFPGPGMKECEGKDVVGGATLAATTFFTLSGQTFTATKPEYQEYVNPAKELDSPAAHTLADPKASTTD